MITVTWSPRDQQYAGADTDRPDIAPRLGDTPWMAYEQITGYVASVIELEQVVRAQRPTRYSPDILLILDTADHLEHHMGATP